MKIIQCNLFGKKAIYVFVDDEDYNWLIHYKWIVNEVGANRNPMAFIWNGKPNKIYLHRMILEKAGKLYNSIRFKNETPWIVEKKT